MPILSMTGHGGTTVSGEGIRVDVQLTSVNRKQRDFRIALPRLFSGCEPELHKVLSRYVRRGAVNGAVTVTWSPARQKSYVRINDAVADGAVAELRRQSKRLGLAGDVTVNDLLAIPGVFESDPDAVSVKEAQQMVLQAVEKAAKRLVQMRQREGRALEKDMRARISAIERQIGKMKKRLPAVKETYRKSLTDRIRKTRLTEDAREEFIAREVVLFAEKSDISEELTRLRSHIGECRLALKGSEESGRALEFILQEIGRELNTIGAKCNDAEMSTLVVSSKLEHDRLREQVQNVE